MLPCFRLAPLGVNVNTELTVDGSSKGVAGVVNVQVRVQSQVIQDSSHGQSTKRLREHRIMLLPLSSTSPLGVKIPSSFGTKSFELLNRPTTIGVNVQVEHTNWVLETAPVQQLIDGSDDFPVDLSQDFSGQDVGQFGLGVHAVDGAQVLKQFQSILGPSGIST